MDGQEISRFHFSFFRKGRQGVQRFKVIENFRFVFIRSDDVFAVRKRFDLVKRKLIAFNGGRRMRVVKFGLLAQRGFPFGHER